MLPPHANLFMMILGIVTGIMDIGRVMLLAARSTDA